MEDENEDEMDPRIQKHLDLLNSASDFLNNSTVELQDTKKKFSKLISYFKETLTNQYNSNFKIIEKTCKYLNLLLKFKIDADTCHLAFQDYQGAEIILDEFVQLGSSIEASMMNFDKSEVMKPKFQEYLAHLNTTNEKIEYWSNQFKEKTFIKETMTAVLLKGYEDFILKFSKKTVRNLEKFDGISFFRKKVLYLRLMKKMKCFIISLENRVHNLNNLYNSFLEQTEILSLELSKMSEEEKDNKINNLIIENEKLLNKIDKSSYSQKVVENRQLVTEFFNQEHKDDTNLEKFCIRTSLDLANEEIHNKEIIEKDLNVSVSRHKSPSEFSINSNKNSLSSKLRSSSVRPSLSTGFLQLKEILNNKEYTKDELKFSLSDLNSTNINLDLSLVGMDSSYFLKDHICLAVTLYHFREDAKVLKIDEMKIRKSVLNIIPKRNEKVKYNDSII